jgi:hypothetical protein
LGEKAARTLSSLFTLNEPFVLSDNEGVLENMIVIGKGIYA